MSLTDGQIILLGYLLKYSANEYVQELLQKVIEQIDQYLLYELNEERMAQMATESNIFII